MKRRSASKGLIITAALVISMLSAGCALLGELLSLMGMDLLGVTPASDFVETGNLEFTLLPRADGGGISLGSLSSSDFKIQVENEDGSMTDCDFVDEQIEEGHYYNSLAVVIDESGSMGREYPASIYGDACLTCPHDPTNMRASAVEELITTLHETSPDSRVGIMAFGPPADSGMDATVIWSDFDTNSEALISSLDQVDGTGEFGTPLYDSLAEIILMTSDDAVSYETMLRSNATSQDMEDVDDPTEEDGEDEIDTEEDVVVGQDDGQSGQFEEPSANTEVGRYILVLSDGDDRDSLYQTRESVASLAREHGITIYAIGLGPASASFEDPDLRGDIQIEAVRNLAYIAEETGGIYAAVTDAQALEELYHALGEALPVGHVSETYSCLPEGEDVDSGDPVEGTVDFGGTSIPWRVIAP